LAKLTNLSTLSLSDNKITDISSLANLVNLFEIYLGDNEITDIYALVKNDGLGKRNSIYLSGNSLSTKSINIYIPQLEDREVLVSWDQ